MCNPLKINACAMCTCGKRKKKEVKKSLHIGPHKLMVDFENIETTQWKKVDDFTGFEDITPKPRVETDRYGNPRKVMFPTEWALKFKISGPKDVSEAMESLNDSFERTEPRYFWLTTIDGEDVFFSGYVKNRNIFIEHNYLEFLLENVQFIKMEER